MYELKRGGVQSEGNYGPCFISSHWRQSALVTLTLATGQKFILLRLQTQKRVRNSEIDSVSRRGGYRLLILRDPFFSTHFSQVVLQI